MQVSYNYLANTNGKQALGIADLKVLNACITPEESGAQGPHRRATEQVPLSTCVWLLLL